MTAWTSLARDIQKIDAQTARKLKTDVRSVERDLEELLDEFTANDDTINRGRVARLLREIDALTSEQADIMFEDTTEGMSKATGAVVAFLVANIGFTRNKYQLDASGDVALRRWVDDLNMLDRTRIIGGSYGDEIRGIIRQGAYRDVPISQIKRQVRQVYDGKDWQLDRLVTSEVENTHRLQFGHTVQENGGEWIQINEYFPASKNRENHECYVYAREDNYGKGQGVFRVSDTKIYSPHPQCTSYLTVPNVDREGNLIADF